MPELQSAGVPAGIYMACALTDWGNLAASMLLVLWGAVVITGPADRLGPIELHLALAGPSGQASLGHPGSAVVPGWLLSIPVLSNVQFKKQGTKPVHLSEQSLCRVAV